MATGTTRCSRSATPNDQVIFTRVLTLFAQHSEPRPWTLDERDFAESVGYRTYMTGKYHVTASTNGSNISNWPLQRGFEKFYGTIAGAGNFFNPHTLVRQNERLEAAKVRVYGDNNNG